MLPGVLERLGSVMRASWGASWSVLGASWAVLVAFKVVLDGFMGSNSDQIRPQNDPKSITKPSQIDRTRKPEDKTGKV